MLSKKDIENIRQSFAKYDYIMTTAQLNKDKLYYRDIQELLEKGLIEKIRRGYHHWIEDYGNSEVVIINRLFPDAVLCMETALFYYKYSDRNPAEWNIAIDKNASRQRLKIDYPFIQAYVVWMAVIYVLVNLITDLMYHQLDPRIRLGVTRE